MIVENNTPFPATAWISSDKDEHKYTTALVRVKYLFDSIDEDGVWTLKFDKNQEKFFSTDIFYDAKKKHVQFESDFVPYKEQAELIINLPAKRHDYGTCGVEVIRYKAEESSRSIVKNHLLKHMSINNLGFVYRGHKSRMQYAGTMDKHWIEHKAPVYPDDFNELHYNAAHPKLQLFKTYFEPGDVIHLYKFMTGVHKQSVLMPGVYLKATCHEDKSEFSTLLEADTVIFDIENLNIEDNCIYVSYRKRITMLSPVNTVSMNLLLEKSLIAEA